MARYFKKTMIHVNNLSKTFIIDITKKVEAVKNISFDIRAGEVFGYLGPNGSGKTTTIKMLLGLIRPTQGTILINNQSPEDLKTKEIIGYLPENPYFYSHLTGYELLDFMGKLFHISTDTRKKRIEELLKKVNMTHASQKPMRGYSKGMLQRIGIAQSLINDPEIIFFDEPMSGLDPIGRREVKDIIIDLKANGKTVFFCSHILEDAQTMCDRAAIIVDGNMAIIDNMKKLTAKHSLEATFIDHVSKIRNSQ